MKYLFCVFVSLYFFLRTYDSAPDEFTIYDLFLLGCLFSLVMAIQLAIYLMASGRKTVQNILLGVFTVANVFSLNVLLVGSIAANSRVVLAGLAFAGVFIAHTIYNILDRFSLVRKGAVFAAGFACISTLVYTINSNKIDIEPASMGTGTSASNVPMIDFVRKPNIYFISLDSLLPRSLLRENLDLETTTLHDVLDQEFTTFGNVFADGVATSVSLNSLLAFDHEYFYSLYLKGTADKLFAGYAPSPLMQIFKHNGYVTNTAFDIPFFGNAKGPFVDNYFFDPTLAACSLIDEKYFDYVFFGYCQVSQNERLLSMLGKSANPMEFMLESIRSVLSTGQPQVFVGYIYAPGHTSLSYVAKDPEGFKQFQQQFASSAETTAEYVKGLLDFLKTNDPDSIVVMFGDHGPYLSRGLEKVKDRSDEDTRFMFLDLHGVFGGVFPKGKCEKWFSATNEIGFKTPIMIAQEVLQCLSDGVPPYVNKTIRGPVFQSNSKYGDLFKDYIYE